MSSLQNHEVMNSGAIEGAPHKASARKEQPQRGHQPFPISR